MFFNDVYERNEFLMESVEADQFNVELYAESMSGDLSDMYEVILESEAEYYNLQEKMMKLEHCAIVTENTTLLAEGKEGFASSVKAKFQNMWEKIKAFFRKVKEWFFNMVQGDKKFLEKHGAKLKRAGKLNFEYNTASFADKSSEIGKLYKDIEKVVKSNEVDDAKNTVKNRAAKILGCNSESTMKEDIENAAKHGAGVVTGKQLFDLISDFKKEKAMLDKLERESDNFFKNLIAGMKSDAKYERATSEEKDKDNTTGKRVKVANIYANIVSKYIGLQTNVLKARKQAARSAAVRLIGKNLDEKEKVKKEKAESLGESFNFNEYDNVLDMF